MLMLIKIMLKLNNEVHIHVRCGRAAMQTQSRRHPGVPIPSRRGAFAARLPMHRFLSDTLAHAPCHALLLTTWGMQLDGLCRTHCTAMPSWLSSQREKLKPCVGSPEMLTMHGYVLVA